MNRFAGIRGAKRPAWIVMGLLVVALSTALVAYAATSKPTKGKHVSESATWFVPYGYGTETQPAFPVLTVGHAKFTVECGGDETIGMTKVRVTAVGGDIMLTGMPGSYGAPGWGPPRVLHAADPNDDTEAIIVLGYGGDPDFEPASPPTAGANTFAVLDEHGPSFSGTAGVVLTATQCIVTIEVAG